MALVYSEFDTTAQNLVKDLKAKILTCTDWADISIATPSTTLGSAAAAGATTITVASSTNFTVGMVVVFEPGTANEEYRTIVTVPNGTSFTVAATTLAHASGVTVRNGSAILKATTARGAQMVIDLADQHPTLQYLAVGFYRTHTGASGGGVDRLSRYVPFRSNTTGASFTMPLHVVLSVSKDHLFFSIEGPRATEAGTTSTTYGGVRCYCFMTDLVPYNASDTTPAVVAFASVTNTPSSTTATQSHIAYISRNFANTASWDTCRIASLSFLSAQAADTVALRRACTIDGNYYLFPYVVFSEAEGMRGRLAMLFYAGSNAPTPTYDEPAPVGDTVTYGGNTYKITLTDRNDGNGQSVWGALGSSGNASANSNRSLAVALPVA